MRFIFKESEDKPMDIYSKPGTKVVYAYPDNGYNYECELAKEILVIGNVYEVEKINVGRFSTTVKLKGIDRTFNSVMFKNI